MFDGNCTTKKGETEGEHNVVFYQNRVKYLLGVTMVIKLILCEQLKCSWNIQ